MKETVLLEGFKMTSDLTDYALIMTLCVKLSYIFPKALGLIMTVLLKNRGLKKNISEKKKVGEVCSLSGS